MTAESSFIETPHLTLLPFKPEHVLAFFRSRHELAKLLGVEVPRGWPVSPESMSQWRETPEQLNEIGPWVNYFYIHKLDGKVIGDGGFKGKPNADGNVEIGYAVLPEYRMKGLATEAAQALMDWAFAQGEVETIYADTLPDGYDSMRVAQKLGMSFDGARHDDAESDIYRWHISHEEYQTLKNPRPDDLTIG